VTPFVVAVAATVVAPATAAAVVGAHAALTSRATYRERFVSGVTQGSLVVQAIAAIAVAVFAVVAPPHESLLAVSPWPEEGGGVLLARVDAASVTMLTLTAALATVVARFSKTYLHREPGHGRFFLLFNLFVTGMSVLSLASRLDHLFVGWELVGISSVLLVGYFHDRAAPVANAVRVLATYRACDAGMLAAVITLHVTQAHHALDLPLAAHEHAGTLVGAMVLLAASGKAGALPFGSWLPRAMEGPTPSSAVFYGGLSVHAGVFLLLRASPLLHGSLALTVATAALGLATAAYGYVVARAQPDAKSRLAYATMVHVGLMFCEIAAGLTQVALVHIVLHSVFRTAQLLRAPSFLHDAAARTAPRGTPRWARAVFAHALHGFYLDAWIDHLVVKPVFALARAARTLEEGWVSIVAGTEEEEPADERDEPLTAARAERQGARR
jgi:NADH-quinone oxidoreductase subunit L